MRGEKKLIRSWEKEQVIAIRLNCFLIKSWRLSIASTITHINIYCFNLGNISSVFIIWDYILISSKRFLRIRISQFSSYHKNSVVVLWNIIPYSRSYRTSTGTFTQFIFWISCIYNFAIGRCNLKLPLSWKTWLSGSKSNLWFCQINTTALKLWKSKALLSWSSSCFAHMNHKFDKNSLALISCNTSSIFILVHCLNYSESILSISKILVKVCSNFSLKLSCRGIYINILNFFNLPFVIRVFILKFDVKSHKCWMIWTPI